MKQPQQRQKVSRAFWIVLFSFVASLSLSSGCDTVAEITFIKENLSSLTALGFRPEHCTIDPLDNCEPPGCGRLEFIMETNRGNLIRPNMQLENLDIRLTPGENIGQSNSDIVFSNTWLFQLEDSGDASRLGLDRTCQSGTDCADGFECRIFTADELPPNDIHAQSGAFYCVKPASVTWKDGSLRYTSIDDDPLPDNSYTDALGYKGLALAINMDNSGSLEGYYDDGSLISPSYPDEGKTDPNSERAKALKDFRSEIFQEERSSLLGRTRMAILDLSGDGSVGVSDVFANDPNFETSFINDDQLNRKVNNQTIFDIAINGLFDDVSGKTPIWEGLKESASLLSEDSDTYAHSVLLFTDSISDGSTSTDQSEALSALTDDRVQAETQIVHLDSLAPRADLHSALRFGPQESFNSIACETGGYYIYDVWPESLERHLRRLGKSHEGRWSIQLEVTAEGSDGSPIALSDLPSKSWYRLAGTMQMTIGDSSEPAIYHFSSESPNAFATQGEYVDTRLLFYVPAP